MWSWPVKLATRQDRKSSGTISVEGVVGHLIAELLAPHVMFRKVLLWYRKTGRGQRSRRVG
jgi:hypothetical protein